MSSHSATISWQLTAAPADFIKGRYSREHTWAFDGGLTVPASPAPAVVPVPYSNPAHVDPEEGFVASIASCHMLTFLFLAGRDRFEVASYQDHAVGTLTKNERGVPWISAVVLSPRIVYNGDRQPTPEEEARLHERAHDGCYITNSVKTEVTIAGPA